MDSYKNASIQSKFMMNVINSQEYTQRMPIIHQTRPQSRLIATIKDQKDMASMRKR